MTTGPESSVFKPAKTGGIALMPASDTLESTGRVTGEEFEDPAPGPESGS
jgi:hypothetical protein